MAETALVILQQEAEAVGFDWRAALTARPRCPQTGIVRMLAMARMWRETEIPAHVIAEMMGSPLGTFAVEEFEKQFGPRPKLAIGSWTA